MSAHNSLIDGFSVERDRTKLPISMTTIIYQSVKAMPPKSAVGRLLPLNPRKSSVHFISCYRSSGSLAEFTMTTSHTLRCCEALCSTMGHTLYRLSQDQGSDRSHPCIYGQIAWSIFVVRVELRRECLSLQVPLVSRPKYYVPQWGMRHSTKSTSSIETGFEVTHNTMR